MSPLCATIRVPVEAKKPGDAFGDDEASGESGGDEPCLDYCVGRSPGQASIIKLRVFELVIGRIDPWTNGAEGGAGANTNYYDADLIGTPGRWGDLTGTCSANPCTPPNGVVDVNDVLASLDKFAGREKAVWKARADLFPAFVNFKIDVADVVQVLNAFGGADYPWSPFSSPCP